MKKSLFFITLLLFFNFVFSVVSCSNFMQGMDAKEELSSQIQRAKSQSVLVRIQPENSSQGSFKNGGTSVYKLTDTINLEFTLNPNYEFINWIVVNPDTYEDISNAVLFSSTTSSKRGTYTVKKATVKFVKAVENAWIIPQCKYTKDVTPPEFYKDAGGNYSVSVKRQNKNGQELRKEDPNNLVVRERANYIQNERVNKLFIELKGLEKESAIETLIIEETFYKDLNGNNVNQTKKTYLKDGIKKSGLGLYSIETEYALTPSNDGFYKYNFYLVDSNGNISEKYPITYYALKDTAFHFMAGQEFSYEVQCTTASVLKSPNITEKDILKAANRLNISFLYSHYTDVLSNNVNDDINSSSTLFSISLDGNTFNPITLNEENGSYYLDITGITRNKGLYVKGIISDNLGNTAEKVVYVPFSEQSNGLYQIPVGAGRNLALSYCNFDKTFMVNGVVILWKTSDDEIFNVADFDYTFSDYVIPYVKNKNYQIYIADFDNNSNTALVSDLYNINAEDINPINLNFTSGLNTTVSVTAVSNGPNTGSYSLKLKVLNAASLNYDYVKVSVIKNGWPYYFYSKTDEIILDNVLYSDLSSVRNVSSDTYKIYVTAYKGEARSNQGPEKSDTNIRLIGLGIFDNNKLSISNITRFNDIEGNDFNNKFVVTAKRNGSNISCSSAKIFYSPVFQNRSLEEIKLLDCLEASSGSNVIDVTSLEPNIYQAYVYVEDDYGNYAYEEISINTIRFNVDSNVLQSSRLYDQSYYYYNGWIKNSSNFKRNMFHRFVYYNSTMNSLSYPFYFYQRIDNSSPVIPEASIKSILQNGTSWNSVLVSYDQPILCQTVYSEKNLGTNPNDWMVYVPNNHITKVETVGTLDTTGTYVYTLDTNVPSNSYYCGIINFADGSVKMTDVMYKE